MSYRVLWIPKGTFLLPGTEARIAELERRGARVVRGDFTPDWPSPLKAMTGRDGKGNHWYQRRDGDEDIFFVAQPDGISYFTYFRGGKFVKMVDPVSGKAKTSDEIVVRKRPEPTREVPLVAAEYEPYEAWAAHREYLHWFTAPETKGRLVLTLGDVRDWATVFVNGREAARLWCEPYACDITPFVRPGKNEIRIEVTSTWYNMLVRDAGRPETERETWTKCGPKADAPYHAAGLLGPVALVEEAR